ncbi:MAG: TetR/AcrR family transcriptional regulator [Solirubrobacteraceae bacterium]|nr:TetR/AcrR family transcriptional regulator [Solirubrobacteraceae bacterium]
MTTQAGGRRYGGRSGAERSAERRDALLDAAFRIVAAEDWHALRIDALCREAGLSKRYFYEEFGNLDDLATALVGRLGDELIAVTVAGVERDPTPTGLVRAALDPFLAHLADDPRRARVLFGAVPGDGDAARRRDEVLRRVMAAAIGLGVEILGAARGPTVDVGASFLVGGTVQAVLDWLAVPEPRATDALADDLAALWQAVVDATFPAPASSARGDRLTP